MNRFRRKKGFTITEILMSLSLLIVFFAIAGEVFRSTVLLSSAGADVSDRAIRADFAITQLRADAWNAASIAVSSPRSVGFVAGNGRRIAWKIDSEDRLVRQENQNTPKTFDGLGKNWSFSSDGVSLIVPDGSPAPVRLVSQILLAERTRP